MPKQMSALGWDGRISASFLSIVRICHPPTEHAGLKESMLLAVGNSASYLHAVYCIFHCEVVEDLEQDLHYILSPVEIVIV